MKIFVLVVLGLMMGGCSGIPDRAKGDFSYEDSSDSERIGVRATSKMAGKTIDVYGVCAEGARRYYIAQTSSGSYKGEGGAWNTKIDGGDFWKREVEYKDDASFLASLDTLEVTSPPGLFGVAQSIKVANDQMERLPELCKADQAQAMARIQRIENDNRQADDQLVSDVVSRTGVKPMLSGSNQMDFNNIISLLQKSGISSNKGKFVWAKDGDYRIAQVKDGRVLLVSMSSPASFPSITIITDKEALEGQFWSSVSSGPLQLMGVSTYQTVLGTSRQTIVFKTI